MMSESEKLIRRLYSITTQVDLGFEHQVNELLKLGCERFGLDIGIVSCINGNTYTVEHRQCPAEVDLPVGAEFELGTTYCVKTISAKGPVGFHHMKESEMASHPAYIAFGLEAYIGIPVVVKNKVHGTLNFSSPHPHSEPFNDIDIDALKLMSVWLGAEIYQRENEHKLLEANQRLEKQAHELEIAKKISDDALNDKSRFLATMSHEIRTPMNGVLGMAELLQQTALSAIQQDYVNTISTSGHLLLTIINDILDYSKLEAGKVDLEHISFNLEYLAYDVMEMLSRTLKKDVQLILDYQIGALQQFFGDPARLRQILFNILGNAIKFTEEGYILLTVRLCNKSENLAELIITIEDTGIGLTDEQAKNLFTAFSQGDLSTTRKYGGTGLGLAISQQLVELMGGTIGVDESTSSGAKFKITLELEVSKQLQVPEADLLNGRKILLVDDNEINRKVISQMLEHFNTDVSVLDSSVNVIETLVDAEEKNVAFDLVLLDYNMPVKDGLSLGKAIRKYQLNVQPLLVVLSSSGTQGDADKFQHAGFQGYLNKPVRSDILAAVLNTVLEKQQEGIITKHSIIEYEQYQSSEASLSGNILLVEDNEVNQLVASAMLDELGLTVDLAINGIEGLEKWQKNHYDLILMDCQMPEMDGYEATRLIRENKSEKSSIPIIALTANASSEDINKCRVSGMNDIITKPFTQNDLINSLSCYLEN